jgi:hypothetical protein
MTQTGGLVILFAWLIFAGLLTILAYLLLRHEQDPLQDLNRPGTDGRRPGWHEARTGQPGQLQMTRIGFTGVGRKGLPAHHSCRRPRRRGT